MIPALSALALTLIASTALAGPPGFAFLEVLSPCTLNWGTVEDPHKTFDILENQLTAVYKLGHF